jgi:hypothetical protein
MESKRLAEQEEELERLRIAKEEAAANAKEEQMQR